jgi:hypothetical protein
MGVKERPFCRVWVGPTVVLQDTRKMICNRCSAIPIQDPSHTWSVQHYSTFTELHNSVQNGCNICALFRRVLLEYYAHGLSSSIEEAEHHQRQLDQESMRGDGEYLNLEERDQREQDTRPTAFFIKAIGVVLDSSFAPCSYGLRGLLYLRECPGEDSTPVNGIWPFVEVSSLPSMHIPQLQY